MSTVPSVTELPAGVVQTSAGLNSLVSAGAWLIGPPVAGGRPQFVLYNDGPSIGTSYGAYSWTSVKDPDGGFSSSTPTRYTIRTPGYWCIDWTIVSAGTGLLTGYAEVVTTASNTLNPSVSLPFCFTSVGNPSSDHPMATSGGLVPVYLFPGDYLQIMIESANADSSGPSFFTGLWVSS